MNQKQFNELSYRELEEKCKHKFSHVTWYRWLKQPNRSPNLHDIELMAPQFGVSPKKLFELIHKRRMMNMPAEINAA